MSPKESEPDVSGRAVPEEGLQLMRLFFSLEQKSERDQVLQMVAAYVRMLKEPGAKTK